MVEVKTHSKRTVRLERVNTMRSKDITWTMQRNRSRRRDFLLDAISCIDQSWWPPSYDHHDALLPAWKHTTISQHVRQQFSIVKSRRISLLMLINQSKAWHVDELLLLIVAGHDGRTADAEHQQRQQRHIYVAYGPLHILCAWFGVSAMFGALAAEIW